MNNRKHFVEALSAIFVLICTLFLVSENALAAPLLQSSNLVYKGSFQVPAGSTCSGGSQDISYVKGGMGFNPVSGTSIFVSGHDYDPGCIAEVSIPTNCRDGNQSCSGSASFAQPLRNAGLTGSIGGEGATTMGGLYVYNNKLYASMFKFYSTTNPSQSASHWRHPLNLSSPKDAGPVDLGGANDPAFRSNYMGDISSPWQTALGGPSLTGNCCLSIISRTSSGPSAYSWNPDSMGSQSAIPLVYYDLSHQTLGGLCSNCVQPIFNGATAIRGIAQLVGTDTVLFYGNTGTGTMCYKGDVSGCSDNGGYNSTSHAFYIWLYNANDLAAVKAGTKQPWEPIPYAHFALSAMGSASNYAATGLAYNPATQMLYMGEQCGYGFCNEVIHAYHIEGLVSTPDTTPPTLPANFNLAATSPSQSSISVTWNPATDNVGVTGYIVERCQSSGCSNFTQVGTPTASPFVDSGLTSNTFYNYHVRARDAANNLSGWSNVVGATTQSATPAPAFTLSASPASITSGSSSTLTWSAVTNATSCAASGGTFTGTKATSGGTQSVSPTITTIYTLSCTGAGGTTNQTTTVTVSGGSGRTIEVRTLSQLYSAFSSEQSGDTIVIYPDGSPYTLNSTALALDQPNITVRGATSNRNDVIIRGDAMSSGATIKMIFLIDADAADDLTIKDLSVGRVGWHAIKFSGENNAGDNSIIDNVRFFDTYEQMLKVSDTGGTSTDNVSVKNSLFEYTAGVGPQYYIGGIDAHRSTGWIVQDNTLRDIQSPSGSVAEPAIHFWDDTAGTGNNVVERNTIVNCDRGIGFWLNNGGTIRNNMILHDGSGAYPDVAIDIQNSPNVRIYNNTSWIASSGYYTNIELRGSTSTGLVLTNNLVNKGIGNISAPSPTLTSNIINAQSSWFVSVASDLHLVSPIASVVNQGISVSGLTDDIDKQSRPQGGGIDIGADEYVTGGSGTEPCNTVTTANFSQAAYNSYGAPFDAFQTSTNLVSTQCNSVDTHTINLTTGVTGDTTRIIYTKGYWYDAVTTAWRQYTGTCTGALNGEWCQGSVSATITDPNVSTANAANPTYLVGMTCSVQGGSWKCGCRDTSCTNFSWQIQGAGLP